MEERALECARRDNIELFDELTKELEGKPKEEIAKFWNEATDVMGNYLLHVCAQYGSCKCLHRLFKFPIASYDGHVLFWTYSTDFLPFQTT